MNELARRQLLAKGLVTQSSSAFMALPFASDMQGLDIAIFGVPFDGGTPVRIGSRHGPRSIRSMSERIHGFHPTYQLSPFARCRVADVGDVEIPPYDKNASLKAIEALGAHLVAADVAPLALGGDHLISLPILRSLAPKAPLALVQFDAHCDTADLSRDGNRYTSATPFRRAIEEGLLDPKHIVQVGLRGTVRSYDKMQWALDQGIRQITIDELRDTGLQATIREVRSIIGDRLTYVTFDIDGIDPTCAPGTGAPVVGGMTSYEALRLLRGLYGARIVGGDVVEVSPPFDLGDMTALLGATLAYEILCLIAKARADASAVSLDG